MPILQICRQGKETDFHVGAENPNYRVQCDFENGLATLLLWIKMNEIIIYKNIMQADNFVVYRSDKKAVNPEANKAINKEEVHICKLASMKDGRNWKKYRMS